MQDKLKNILRKTFTYYLAIGLLIVFLLYISESARGIYPLNVYSFPILLIFFLGVALRSSAKKIIEETGYGDYPYLIKSSGLILIGLSILFINTILNKPSRFSNFIDVCLFLFSIAITIYGITNIFVIFEKKDDYYISVISKGVLDSQKIIVFFATFFSFYYRYVRISFEDVVQHVIYIDWLVIVIFGFFISILLWDNLSENFVKTDFKFSGKTHFQKLEFNKNEELMKLEKLQKQFVEEGKKEYLLIHLINMIMNNTNINSKEKIPAMLNPLIYYRDKYIDWNSFKWWKNKLEDENIRRRKEVLDIVIKNIEEKWNLDIDNIQKGE